MRVSIAFIFLASTSLHAAITGTVYRDINQNGVQNPPEPGVAGISVRAYSSANVLVAQSVSGATGSYSLATSAGNYRIEYDRPSFLQAAGGTLSSNVRFAADGATGVNLALANPTQYCEAGTFQGLSLPRVQVAQFTQGQRGFSATQRALGTYAYNITPTGSPAAESADVDAILGDIGSVWAVAHHRRSNYLLSASFFRRHTELGPGRGAGTNNTGVIYVVDPGTNTATANTAKVFADINQIAGSAIAGAAPRPNPVPANYNFFHDTGNGTTTTTATELFRAVGKIGLGGMDLSEDGNTLYVINLGDRQLYQFDAAVLNSRPALTSPQTPLVSSFKNPPVPIPTGVCANPVDARPFASKFVDGFLYVGVTCTAESTVPVLPPTATTGSTSRGDLSQLRALVWRFNPATQSFDNAPGMPVNPVINFPLDFPRGCIQPVQFGNGLPSQSVANQGGACNPTGAGIDSRGAWQPWQPNWQVIFSNLTPGNIQNDPFYIEYPQPLLTDLEVDGVGALILGFRDINGDKVGYCSGSPNTGEGSVPGTDPAYPNCAASGTVGNPAGTHRGNGEGDILRACGTPQTGWTLESGGVCGGVAANNPLPTIGGTAPANGQGPGNGEFYWSDSGPSGLDNATGTPGAGLGYVSGQNGHGETTMGALALVPNPNFNLVASGTPGSFVITTMIDARGYYDGGMIWMNNATGQSGKRIRVYNENFLAGGKSGGLGDLELMCPPAPTQIGNRVWNDANGNGIQDPGEAPISGVTVEVWSTANALLGRTSTNASGEWYINFSVGATDGSNTDANIILPNPYESAYRLYLPQSQTGASGSTTGASGALSGLTATTPTADLSVGGNVRDSNGVVQFDPDGGGAQLGRVGANFSLAGMGETDHSLDFGFRQIGGTSVNPGIQIDDGQLQCGNSPRVYTITINNPASGSAAFTGLPFAVSYPGNISPTSWTCSGSGGATCSAASGSGNPAATLQISSMPVNSTATIAMTVNESPACSNASGNVVLTASIPQRWGTFQDTNMANNFDDDVDVPTGDLSILLQNPGGQYCPGQTSIYTLVVSNAGPATAANVGVTMPLPDPPYNPGLTSWSRTGGTGTVVSGSSGIAPALNSIVTLLPGQSVIYTIQAYVRSNVGSPTLTQTASLSVPSGFTDTSAANNNTQDVRSFCGDPPVSTSFCAVPGQDGIPAAAISGVVNTYWQGEATTVAAGTAPGGSGCAVGSVPLPVSTRSGAAVNVATGDLLLIVQMQDAVIDSADSDNYGDGTAGDTNNAGGATDYANVGRYEYVRAAAPNTATGSTNLCVSAAGANSGLLQQYRHNISGIGRRQTWQVVRIPQYQNVRLSDSAALTAPTWNGRLGGIVALDVANQLSFNNSGSINVAGLGFRGGPSTARGTVIGGSTTSWRNTLLTPCHNDKGEGLAGTPSTIAGFGIDYPNGSFARGAPGNAGGGGNLGSCGSNDNDEGGGGGGAACGDGGFGGRRDTGTENSRGRGGGDFDGGLSDAQLMRNRLILGGGAGAGQRSG
ncbi:MAG: SdrD B-like domain-containing protein, partial [Lysobacterales bacterium]